MPEVEFRAALTTDELKAAARLVYREYCRRGYVPPHDEGLRLTIFHAIPDTVMFLAVHQILGVIGTVTLIPDSPLGLPMDDVYGPELADLRARGHRLAEASMFAFDRTVGQRDALPMFRINQLTLTLRLFKALFDHLRHETRTSELLACAHPRHRRLYEFLQMESLAGQRPYASVGGHPALAWRLNLARSHARSSRVPVLRFFYGSQHVMPPKLRPRTLSEHDLQELFVQSSSVFATADLATMAYLQLRYPTYTFALA